MVSNNFLTLLGFIYQKIKIFETNLIEFKLNGINILIFIGVFKLINFLLIFSTIYPSYNYTSQK